MKAPAPGGNPGRAVTSEQQSKSTAFIVETPDPRPVFTLRLKPMPGTDGRSALRALLKVALRQHRLVCLACHEERPPAVCPEGAPEGLLDRRAAWLAEAERRAGR
jgi:hypothetical protein